MSADRQAAGRPWSGAEEFLSCLRLRQEKRGAPGWRGTGRILQVWRREERHGSHSDSEGENEVIGG